MKEKILAALSGGVDSAAAALLLLESGHDVSGITMKLYCGDEDVLDSDDIGTPTRDIIDAKSICDTLGIEHITIALGESFRQSLIERFIE